jgi:hypothetical protein
MSKILEMLEAVDKLEILEEEDRQLDTYVSDQLVGGAVEKFGNFSRVAIPDIKRIVEWVESADHKSGCDMWEHPHTGFCDCGLSEIQSLIRSDK